MTSVTATGLAVPLSPFGFHLCAPPQVFGLLPFYFREEFYISSTLSTVVWAHAVFIQHIWLCLDTCSSSLEVHGGLLKFWALFILPVGVKFLERILKWSINISCLQFFYLLLVILEGSVSSDTLQGVKGLSPFSPPVTSVSVFREGSL